MALFERSIAYIDLYIIMVYNICRIWLPAPVSREEKKMVEKLMGFLLFCVTVAVLIGDMVVNAGPGVFLCDLGIVAVAGIFLIEFLRNR